MKPNGIIVFFCNTKFGYALINSNPKWFKYDLIWEKSKKVGFLSANKMPLRKHENIYIFSDNSVTYSKKGNYGTYNPQKTEGEPYTVLGGKSKKVNGSLSRGHEVISKPYENKGDRHPTSILPEFEEETHENIYIFKKEQGTYNPQKTEGKPYNKTNTGNNNSDQCAYGEIDRNSHLEGEGNRAINKGDRHPTSILPEFEKTILKFNNPHKTIHRTQKPVDLLEWLIKTYSNEEDLVMDFCMGSGSCGMACKNTNRKFIGVEKDEEIFKLAEERLKN
jgi:DNA modification methylase